MSKKATTPIIAFPRGSEWRKWDLHLHVPGTKKNDQYMVGTTRSRVSFFMNRFRKLGFIDYGEGGLQVHSSLLNVVLHD